MELPPKVKTQFATKNTIAKEEVIPVPIETAFFIEDAIKDNSQYNRYYFNFPAEWCTANKGESIIGVRSIWLVAHRRKLDFCIRIHKIHKASKLFDTKAATIDFSNPQYNTDLKAGNIHNISFRVIDWISVEKDLRGVFDSVHKSFKETIERLKVTSYWNQNDDYIAGREIQLDGIYDQRGFHEIIYSEQNKAKDPDYLIYFEIFNENEDFREVFNIGTGPNENDPSIYQTPHKQIIFNNIWDRHSCKVYSSIGEQSLHHYIGNSQKEFSPIKYYKLSSTDQQFWIELYSGRQYKVPIKLPKNESFVIEMQFLPYNKMLYI